MPKSDSHLCSELVSFLGSLTECPEIVSQNRCHSAKTSACCLHSCQQHCSILAVPLQTLLNLTWRSFSNPSNGNSSKIRHAQIGFCFFSGSQNGITQKASRNQSFKLTLSSTNCPLTSLQIKDWIVPINKIYPSKSHLNDTMAIKRTGVSNSTKSGLSISHSSSG